MTRHVLISSRKSTWQMDREVHIAERNERIRKRNFNDPRAQFRVRQWRERPTNGEMVETFPFMYEFLAEMIDAEAESYTMSIQEDEVEF